MATATMRINEQHNGIEILFASKPDASTLDTLKANGFRWHRSGGYWYNRNTAENMKTAEAITGGTIEATKPEKVTKKNDTKKANKYGVRVGDWFSMSWGYEQTNNDFFQVVALVGESSVRIRQADPEMIAETGYSHGMAADRVFRFTNEIQPPTSSVFIKDNEKGDLKRIKSFAADGVSNPQIYMTSYADAHYVGGDGVIKKVYESWYA